MKRISLSFVLPAAIVALCLLVAAATAITGFAGARNALLKASERALSSAVEQRAQGMQEYFDSLMVEVATQGADPSSAQALAAFETAWAALGANAPADVRRLYIDANTRFGSRRHALVDAGDGSGYSAAHAQYHSYFAALVGEKDYYDIFLIGDDGTVLYTVYKEADLGENLLTGSLADSGLAAA